MSARPTFPTVTAYLAALPPAQAKALRQVLAIVQKAVPRSTRVIRYGIPAFRQDRVFLYCAAFKRHIGIYPPVRGDARLAAALARYANAKGNLSFPLEEPLPASLVARVAKSLATQYAPAAGARKTPKARPTRQRAPGRRPKTIR